MPGGLDYVRNKDGTKGERWNPITGCIKDLRICPLWENCWARKRAVNRLSKVVPERYPPEDPFAPQLHKDRLDKPEKWQKPRGIYVSYMGDMFNSQVPDKWIEKVLGTVRVTPRHRYLFLTKRPHRYWDFMQLLPTKNSNPPKNGWYGTSINRFIDITRLYYITRLSQAGLKTYASIEPLTEELAEKLIDNYVNYVPTFKQLHWVVLGGWSKKDNSHLEDYVRQLTDIFVELGLSVWHKDNLDLVYKQDNPVWKEGG